MHDRLCLRKRDSSGGEMKETCKNIYCIQRIYERSKKLRLLH